RKTYPLPLVKVEYVRMVKVDYLNPRSGSVALTLPRPLAQLLGVLDRDLARAPQHVEQELQLCHRVALELDLPAVLQRAVDVPRHLHRLVGELDDDAAAGGGGGPAAGPGPLPETGGRRGDGAR